MTAKIRKLTEGEAKLIDIWHYIVGNIRYRLYYTPSLAWLIRRHIAQQITYRIKWMDEDCYNNGSCKLCGCETTALQMAKKSCKKPCYPTLMSKQQWLDFKAGGIFVDHNGQWTVSASDLKPILLWPS